ncbi:class I SAM-dependent DNA methyltransferase [Neofamilia massiliensis]|uniref:class I SAM-dependent DNA methyltransferase n=1 Tax=Neofamilia massiliensis TaxID=1673724 RepID=UPI0006BB8E51|nr:class I SAM-dependent methyltransferase [Neofamilia massiliensis]
MNYLKFAKIYDKLIYDVDYDKIVDFINREKEKYNIKGNSLLELGCGTGNITSKLNGYNIIAMDNSDEMLSLAREKSFGRRNIRFLQGDIRDFSLNKDFDMAIAVLDVFNYITEYDDLLKVFDLVYKHLKKDGLFIFDVNSAYKISEFIGNNIFSDEVDDTLYVWQGSFDEETKINEYLLTFFQKVSGSSYERFDETHRERAYTLEEIYKALDQKGFTEIKVYDSYTYKEVSDKTLRLTFVARKDKDE